MNKFFENNKRAFAMFALAFALLVSVGGANVAYAACPAVPADCTVDDVVGTSATTIVDTTLATLVTNLPVIVAGGLAISIGFALIKLAMRWAKKFIR